MRLIIVPALLAVFTTSVQAQTSPGAWQTPAEGPPLGPDAAMQLAGRTCWGFFDKGNNSETARGAIFVRFSPSSPTGDFWRKWGKVAQEAARRDDPAGYEYVGKTTIAHLTPTGTEITFSADRRFDWFIRPTSPGNYMARAVGNPDTARGAVGELHCI